MVPVASTKKTRFAFWRQAAPADKSKSPADATPSEQAAATTATDDTKLRADGSEAVAADAVLRTTPAADVTVTLGGAGNIDKSLVKEDVPVKKSVLRAFISGTRAKAVNMRTAIKTASSNAASKTKKVFCCFSKQ